MAIRFVDVPSRLGRIVTALDSVTSAIAGTHVGPPPRTGVMSAQLDPFGSVLFSGTFSLAAARSGFISAALTGVTALFGSVAGPVAFLWQPATQNADGSAIAAGEITGYEVGVRLAGQGAPGTYSIILAVDGAFTSAQLVSAIQPALAAGSYLAAVRSVGPVNSPWSTEFSFTV